MGGNENNIYRKGERTMKKKIIVMAAALGVSIAAVGCGSQASTETTTTTTTEAATTTTTAATSESATTSATEATTVATTAETTAAATEITEAKAKEIALKAAGFAESDVTFKKIEQDIDNGIKKFEIEFIKDAKEYSYDINMATGEIISQEVDAAND